MVRSTSLAKMTKLKRPGDARPATRPKNDEQSEDSSATSRRSEKSVVQATEGPKSWTPFAAYETALMCCIQATQDFAVTQQKDHRDHAGNVSHARQKIEAFARTMKKAYNLLAAEATQTHTSSPRIGMLFTDSSPPSYEQAMNASAHSTSGSTASVCALKDREQKWRIWWTALCKRKSDQAIEATVLQEQCLSTLSSDRVSLATIANRMNQVENYLQDVENAARKYLQDIETSSSTENKRKKVHSGARTCDLRTGISTKQHPSETTTEKHRNVHKRAEGEVQPKASKQWLSTWLSRSFSPQRGQQRRPARNAMTTVSQHKLKPVVSTSPDSALTASSRYDPSRSIKTQTSSTSHSIFKPYKIEALYDYEPASEIHAQRGDLRFTAGQIMDAVSPGNRNWHHASYIDDASGETLLGNVARGFTAMYHPEISAIMAKSKFTRTGTKLGVTAISRGTAVSSLEDQLSVQKSLIERAQSLSEWLDRERKDWSLAMADFASCIARRRPPSLYDVPALIERLDALGVWVKRHRGTRLDLTDLIDRMVEFRGRVKSHLREMQSGGYEKMLHSLP